MAKRSKIDPSLGIAESLKANPMGTACSICWQHVPEARPGIKSCLCVRCTYAKADERCNVASKK